jgi:hypothetical protein
VLFCGTVVICLFIHLEIVNDSVNDMAVISISHLNKDICYSWAVVLTAEAHWID